jgi:hypothetical protein
MEIEKNLQNILKICASCPEVDIYITQGGLIRHTTIAISFEQKKTLEKSGVQ